MELWPAFIKRSLAPRSPEQEVAARHEGSLKAVRMLGERRLADARRRAGHVLHGARRCACCKSLLEHLFERVGSTLFLDDDPESLIQALRDEERDPFSARVLAAWIVLRGRERVVPAF